MYTTNRNCNTSEIFISIFMSVTLTYSRSYLMLVFITSGRRRQVRNHGHRTLGIAVHRPCLFQRHHHRCSLDRFSCAPHGDATPARDYIRWCFADPAIAARQHDARFSSKSRHSQRRLECPLSANSGHRPRHPLGHNCIDCNYPAIVSHFETRCSAPRCDTAKIVKVGFDAPSVGNRPGPATHRLLISWVCP